MKIEFATGKYRYAYGHEPKGRGWWWFTFEGYEFQATGTYTEAKKACRAYVKYVAPEGYAGNVIVTVET